MQKWPDGHGVPELVLTQVQQSAVTLMLLQKGTPMTVALALPESWIVTDGDATVVPSAPTVAPESTAYAGPAPMPAAAEPSSGAMARSGSASRLELVSTTASSGTSLSVMQAEKPVASAARMSALAMLRICQLLD